MNHYGVSPASILPLVQLLLVLIVIRSAILLPLVYQKGRPKLGAPPPPRPPHPLTSSSSLSSSDDSLSSL
ncbi:hypothetical protein Tco_0416666, partial [Tanacetum coccineum]